MDDETLLKLMKNGLMVAGHEMGPAGDHWPALKAISNGLDREFEELGRDEAVLGELEFHIAEALRKLEEAAEHFSPEIRVKTETLLRELWDHYYSIFEPVASNCEPQVEDILSDEEMQRMKNINAALRILKGMGGRA